MSPSPIRCRGAWKIHRRSSEPDRWLDEMGFFRKHTARDASCLFRAVSENIYNTQRYCQRVRLDCIQFMASNRNLFEGSLSCTFENYLKEMSSPSEWGGFVEISAMSHLYRRDFVVFEANKGPQTKICNGFGDAIFLFYSPESKHFDAVYTKDFIQSSSFCQSLVYEILYDGVYQLKDLPYAVDKMLHDKVPSNHIEYFMSENVERRKKQKERAKIFIETSEDDKDKTSTVALKCKHHTQDLERASLLKESLSIFVFNRSLIQLENVCMNCLNVNSAKDLLDNGITPFPYKVAKALDPDIYRNIEFDVWSELRREMRYGARYSDGTTLQVGVRCLCKMLPDQSVPYHCHIQEMRPDGPSLVYIEELGEKRWVKYEQLEPLPLEEIRPWAPPYRYSRANAQFLTLSQMLQQIGNISRKQGLKGRKSKGTEDSKSQDKGTQKTKIDWKRNNEPDASQDKTEINLSTYQHLDFENFEPMPVEVSALPLMVDCRAGPGAAPEAPHPPHQPNGAPPPEHHVPIQAGLPGAGAELALGGGRHTPQQPPPPHLQPYPGAAMGANSVQMPYGCAPYACGVKSLLWCPPPPPHGLPHVYKSVQPNGADLPMNDIPTLRYYFNLGVECMWAAYGGPPAPGAPPPPRYGPRDAAIDLAALSLADRDRDRDREHNKKANNAPKTGPQRPLLGPRFKRGNNGDGNNQNSNHNQNKNNHGHNNNIGNKGPNNRRNSHPDSRVPPLSSYGEGECPLEPPMLAMPYIPYPPPLYSIPYYPVESDPAMMGMMGGMGYVGYDEGGEYLPYYPPPHYPPPPPPPPPHAPHPLAPHGPPHASSGPLPVQPHHSEHK